MGCGTRDCILWTKYKPPVRLSEAKDVQDDHPPLHRAIRLAYGLEAPLEPGEGTVEKGTFHANRGDIVTIGEL